MILIKVAQHLMRTELEMVYDRLKKY